MAAELVFRATSELDPVLTHLGGLERRPGETDRWNVVTVTAAWLASRKSVHTRRAYEREIRDFFAWSGQTGLDPRDCRRGDIDAYATVAGGHLGPASLARRLSTISSWYQYAQSNDLVDKNPALAVDRPVLSPDASTTMGLTPDQLRQFMRTARDRCTPRDTALLALFAELGLRCSEVLGLNLDDFSHDLGHRVVTVHGKGGKGGKSRKLPVPAPLGRDLDRYFGERALAAGVPVEELTGPTFITRTGRRLDQPAVYRLVQRVGKAAGIPGAEHLSVHSLRHSVATAGLEKAPLHAVQDLLGHADPRTTRRYDRACNSLDRSAAYAISELFAEE